MNKNKTVEVAETENKRTNVSMNANIAQLIKETPVEGASFYLSIGDKLEVITKWYLKENNSIKLSHLSS